MATKEQLTERIKKIAAQLSGKIDEDHGILLPPFAIKGTGEAYFLSYVDRQFVKIARGTEVYIVETNFDYYNRTLVYTYGHDLILIEPDEIELIGFD